MIFEKTEKILNSLVIAGIIFVYFLFGWFLYKFINIKIYGILNNIYGLETSLVYVVYTTIFIFFIIKFINKIKQPNRYPNFDRIMNLFFIFLYVVLILYLKKYLTIYNFNHIRSVNLGVATLFACIIAFAIIMRFINNFVIIIIDKINFKEDSNRYILTKIRPIICRLKLTKN